MAISIERNPAAPPGDRPRVNSSVWTGPFILGLLMSILGVISLGAAFLTSLVTAIFFGAMLAIAGIAEFVSAFHVRRSGGPFLLYLLGGVLSTVVGFFVLIYPGAGLAALTLLIAGYFFASGLFHAITSAVDRYPQWGWDFLYGAVTFLLGVIVMAEWPISAVWLVGTLVGIGIFFRGIALMTGSMAVRRVLRNAEA